MKMKKVVRMLGLCALVALAITSCKKNEEQSKQLTILATINQPVAEGRTHIGPDNMLVWDAGNSIKVFNANGEKGDFTTQAQDEWEKAPFTGTLTPTDTYTAFYPNAVVDGTNVKINLNATQNYVNNNFGNDTYPMYATGITDGNNIEFGFDSHASVLRLQFKSNNNCRVGSIIVKGNTGDVYAGNLVYAYNDPSTCTVENGTNEVTLNCGNGVDLIAGTPTDFNIVLKSGTLTTGTKVTVKDHVGNVIKEFTTSQSNPLNPRHILIMGEQEVVYNLPTVTTTAATNVTYTAATLNGEYTEIPGAAVTSCGFYFSENEADVQNKVASAKVSCASVGSPMSYPASGLTAGTTYYFRAWAANATGENWGQVLSFTTPVQVVDPTATTVGNGTPTANTCVVNGSFTDGGDSNCEYGFYWGENQASASKKKVGNGASQSFNTTLTGLFAGLTYHYRAYAKNSTGETKYGEWKEFTTTEPVIGNFSVGPDTQVTFAPGNLWLENGTTWHMENRQYYYHNAYSGNAIDMFSWSNSNNDFGVNHYENCENPNFVEWGQHAICKPNSTETYPANTWRTLTGFEWLYVFCYRTNAANLRGSKDFGEGSDRIHCTVLMPDGWSGNIQTKTWQELEAEGAAIFPMCGGWVGALDENFLFNVETAYWSSTPVGNGQAKHIYAQYVDDASINYLNNDEGMYYGNGSQYHKFNVRLAKNVN